MTNDSTIKQVQTGRKVARNIPPNVAGEQSISGSAPDPEADDDTLENAHQMGIGLTADEENPQELNIAEDIVAAERRRRGIDFDDEIED